MEGDLKVYLSFIPPRIEKKTTLWKTDSSFILIYGVDGNDDWIDYD